MNLTGFLVPTYLQMLRALSAWLDKAQRQVPAADAEGLLAERLAADMYPLSSQICFACLQAQEAVFRLRGEPQPSRLEHLARVGRDAGDDPGTLADAHARIDEALALLASLGPDALDAGAHRPISIELPNGMAFDMTGEQYARDWALPQFSFHLMTAYAILRSRAIALGKADYVPHMFAYLRPAPTPQG
jgi:hypothetical protein